MAWSKISLALACLISFFALPCFAQNWEKLFFDAQNNARPMLKVKPTTSDNFEKQFVDAQNQVPDTVKVNKPATSDNLKKEFLDAQNQVRAQLNLKPMTWDNQVAAYAQGYANQRIGDCGLVHSEGPYGENIAWGSGDLSARDAVKMWVDEKVYYNHEANTCASDQSCGHYTQIVWRDSVRVGCAKVRCDNGGTFITCNYNPPGNIIGQKPF